MHTNSSDTQKDWSWSILILVAGMILLIIISMALHTGRPPMDTVSANVAPPAYSDGAVRNSI